MAIRDGPERNISDGDQLNKEYFNWLASSAPIGAIMGWLKSYTNTPSLPDGWLECDGSSVSDSDSPYNGQTLPDLNGDNRFLRGNTTSGGTGGSETHSHDAVIVGRSGGLAVLKAADGTTLIQTADDNTGGGSGTYSQLTQNPISDVTKQTSTESTLPTHYEVVWIIRIK